MPGKESRCEHPRTFKGLRDRLCNSRELCWRGALQLESCALTGKKEGLPFVVNGSPSVVMRWCAPSVVRLCALLAALRPYESPSKVESDAMKLDMLR